MTNMKLSSYFITLAFFLVDVSSGTRNLSNEYRFTADLADGDYVLHWNVDMQKEELTFAVNVSTNGWVGFGISPNGQMPGSDVVIAWVDSNGQVMFQVRNCYILGEEWRYYSNLLCLGSTCYRSFSSTD